MKESNCMTMKEYMELMKRFRQTPEQMSIIAERMQRNAHQIHALFGMETELGELFDIFKRHLIYGEDIDKEHAEEEVGDFLYYFGLFLDVIGIEPSDAMSNNFQKLSKRYPLGFSEEAGIARADKDGLPDDKRKTPDTKPNCILCRYRYMDHDETEFQCRCHKKGGEFGANYAKFCKDVTHCTDGEPRFKEELLMGNLV